VTADGRLLYQHERSEERVLVAPWVAAGMTDLLQSAVLSGTGRAAQIGRPVAGKTGTTSSNKDGWFIGFSSGITTGVWMGRDDARAVGGLQGGTAPARAFHDFMTVAVANRPVENFETEVPLPDWQLEPDEEMWGTPYDENMVGPIMVDENGMPIGPQPDDPLAPSQSYPAPDQRTPDQTELDRIFNSPPPPPQRIPQQQQPREPAVRTPPRSQPTPDPLQPRGDPSQL
jgi:penicillin-binding protein 1A